MKKTVLQEIKDEMDSLRSGYNGWKRLVEFFETNKQIKPYYEEIVEECRRDNYFGMATMMIMTLEKLLEEIEDFKDEVNFITGEKVLKFPQGKTIVLPGNIVEIKDHTQDCIGCFYDPAAYVRCTKCSRNVSNGSDLFIPEVDIRTSINKALEYIKNNNSLVEIQKLAEWKESGILCSIKNDENSEFCFDKKLRFIDSTEINVWI